MCFKYFIFLIKSDFYRYNGCTTLKRVFASYIFEIGARYSFWLRLTSYLHTKTLLFPFFIFAWFGLRRQEIKLGISVPYKTNIGPGLYFSHAGGIVVNALAKIGNNCNLGHGVTIGQANRGKRKGYPTIGNNVFIGPGAKIFGNVKIGSNVAIGANSVVTSDVPDHAVVAGLPARVISMEGSEGYIDWIDYPGST